jgi:hypothetical protein
MFGIIGIGEEAVELKESRIRTSDGYSSECN